MAGRGGSASSHREKQTWTSSGVRCPLSLIACFPWASGLSNWANTVSCLGRWEHGGALTRDLVWLLAGQGFAVFSCRLLEVASLGSLFTSADSTIFGLILVLRATLSVDFFASASRLRHASICTPLQQKLPVVFCIGGLSLTCRQFSVHQTCLPSDHSKEPHTPTAQLKNLRAG